MLHAPLSAHLPAAAVAFALVASPLWATTGALAATPTDLPQEQIAAIGEAGTVYLSGTWSGFVNFPTADGGTAWSDEVDASFSCSGFVASADGSVVTAGHCADVAEGKTAIIDTFLDGEVQNGDITAEDEQGYLAAGAESSWPVEGEKTGEAPVLTMKVYPAITITADDSTSYPAVLVDDRPLDQGDVALFKIDTPSPLPVLVVSSSQPATGQQVDAIGYPGNVTSLVSGNPEPTFAQGQVSGRQQTDGGPFTQVGVAMSPGMSGGPVVDGSAAVVGTVSFGPSSDTQQLNFAAAPETISALLSRNGVKNELGAADVPFRAGLDEYFAGKYHAAADDLAAALAANPDNAIATQYQEKAIAAFPQENTTGWVLWLLLGGGLLVIVIALVVLLLVLSGRRRRARAAGGYTVTDSAAAPGYAVADSAAAPGYASAGASTSIPTSTSMPTSASIPTSTSTPPLAGPSVPATQQATEAAVHQPQAAPSADGDTRPAPPTAGSAG
ncbi:trypsin-like peptidase domain-containing protein [Subtercola sp. YIM 133946]|uniref:trypsin-like peptidase domain-containing protein n=1 Tax=Subtercola sp. YIM 133946 TaxID=3118909 RepID=UPI002F9351E6